MVELLPLPGRIEPRLVSTHAVSPRGPVASPLLRARFWRTQDSSRVEHLQAGLLAADDNQPLPLLPARR